MFELGHHSYFGFPWTESQDTAKEGPIWQPQFADDVGQLDSESYQDQGTLEWFVAQFEPVEIGISPSIWGYDTSPENGRIPPIINE